MICVSLGNINFAKVLSILKKINFAEIRLDKIELTPPQIQKVFSQPIPLIATYRPVGKTDFERTKVLIQAIESGAQYVDIEIESKKNFRKEIMDQARKAGCQIIISYHNFDYTPDKIYLKKIVKNCMKTEAHIAKLACQVKSSQDNAQILSLYDSFPQYWGKLIALGMGEAGKITRIAAPFLGAPFTYTAWEKGQELASGQIDFKTLNQIHSLMKS